MLTIDKWYEDEKIVSADCFFSDIDCVYRGNFYNMDGKIIGDYSATCIMDLPTYVKIDFGP